MCPHLWFTSTKGWGESSWGAPILGMKGKAIGMYVGSSSDSDALNVKHWALRLNSVRDYLENVFEIIYLLVLAKSHRNAQASPVANVLSYMSTFATVQSVFMNAGKLKGQSCWMLIVWTERPVPVHSYVKKFLFHWNIYAL